MFLETLASANRRVTNPYVWLLLLAAVTALPAVPRPAAAAVIVQESFDYAVGPLAGNNGGTGFSAAWINKGTAATVSSPGLTYGSLSTSGNKALGATSISVARTFDSTGLTGDGATYWFSYLFAAPDTVSTGTSASGLSFFSDVNGSFSQAGGFYLNCDVTSSTNMKLDTRIGGTIGPFVNVPGTNYHSGDPMLIVGRITFSDQANQDSLEVWLDPPLTGSAPTGSPTVSYLNGNWGAVAPADTAVYWTKYNAPDRVIDEIRLATSFADIAPVPEPGTLGLALLAATAATGFAVRRRQR